MFQACPVLMCLVKVFEIIRLTWFSSDDTTISHLHLTGSVLVLFSWVSLKYVHVYLQTRDMCQC